MRIVAFSEIDEDHWNNLVENSSHKRPDHYSWFLKTVSSGLKVLEYEEQNELSYLPLTRARKWMVLKKWANPLFLQRLEWLGEVSNESKRTEEAMRFLEKHLRSFSFCFKNRPAAFEQSEVHKRRNLILNLNKSYEELFYSFSKNHKRKIKKAYTQDLKLHFKDELNRDDLKFLSDELIRKIQKFNNVVTGKIQEIVQVAQKNKALLGVTVKNNAEDTLAVAIFLCSSGKILYPTGIANEQGYNKEAMALIFNELIKKYAQGPYVLDFEGSQSQGIARFFKGFGAYEDEYYQIVKKSV